MTQRNPWSVLVFGALVAVYASVAFAVAPQRTFVSSGGNDSNPCSLASPCRGFQAAINAVAAKGEVLVLDSAGYGQVTITKSVSLIAPNGIYAGITVASGDGITISANEATVVLRGLSINGQGGNNGISVLPVSPGGQLNVESCVISNMVGNGIAHAASGLRLTVLDTIIRSNGGSGIFGDAAASVVLDHVRSEHNGDHGFILNTSNNSPGASATITDSIFAFNGIHGIFVASTIVGITRAQIERSVISNNAGDGIRITAAGTGITRAGVTRSSIQSNGMAGVAAFGESWVYATISENAIGENQDGIVADGENMRVLVTANRFTYDTGYEFASFNGGSIISNGDNVGYRYSATGDVSKGNLSF